MHNSDSNHFLSVMKRDFQVVPVLAAELEWYIMSPAREAANEEQRSAYLLALSEAYSETPHHSIEKERGMGQVEVALLPTDAANLISQLAQLKTIASQIAAQQQLIACFEAKPFPEEYGSGLHIHIHLENMQGESLYYVQQEAHELVLSEMLSWSIGGLLASLEDNIPIFAGSAAAMARYQPWKDAPIAANWGYNNRTTALRLPDNVGHSRGADTILTTRGGAPVTRRYKRIEHRAPSSEADVMQVITALVSGLYFGLSTRICAPAPTYGNSYMEIDTLSLFMQQ